MNIENAELLVALLDELHPPLDPDAAELTAGLDEADDLPG